MNETGDSVRVLHVEDDPEFAELTASVLEQEIDELTVQSATSPEEGLAALAQNTVDCVVSDYDMPGQNGIEFLEAVREEYPELPFILYTGKGSEEVASDAISTGVTDYLQKEGGIDHYTVLANRITNAVESHRSRQALGERNRELRSYERLINSMEEGACIYDEEGRIEVANEYLAQWYNTTCEALEGQQSNLLEAVKEQRDGDPYRELLDGKREQITGEVAREFPGHGYAVLGYRLTPLVADDAVEGVVGVARDVTDRKEREQKLEQLRERTTELMYTETTAETTDYAVSAANDIIGAPLSGVHLLNDDGSVLEPSAVANSVRDAFTEIPSFERDGPPGSRAAVVWDVFREGDPRYVASLSASSQVDEESPAESVVLHPLGDHGMFVISSPESHAFTDTDRLLIEILANNLEAALDRVTREQLLRTREEHLELLHEATRDLIQADSRERITERIAEAAEEILGFSIAVVRLYDSDAGGLVPVAGTEQVSTILPERPVFTPDDGSLNWSVYEAGEVRRFDDIEALEYAVDQGTGIRSIMVLPMGEYGTLSVGETVPGAFDDTDEFLARILATAAHTALASQEQKRRLQTRHNELERQNERLDEFASLISHDLRNPLTVANLQLELVARDCDSEHLEAVERAHDRMNTLIDDLLVLARTGEQLGDTEVIDLASLVQRCWQTVDTPDSTLVTRIDGRIRADRSRLKQLLENLVRNSIEHSSAGATVTVGSLPNGFYVEDDGPGIAADERTDVFDVGYSTTEEGTGFGLSIVRQIVEAHGWEIAVTEGDAGGARFEITGVEFASE